MKLKSSIKIISVAYLGIMVSSLFLTALNPIPVNNTLQKVSITPFLVIYVLILAPFLEEWLYRNLLIISVHKKLSIPYEYLITLSSILFALSHFDPWLLPYAINGWIYSILKIYDPQRNYNLICHILYNFTVLLIQFLN